MEDSVTLSHSEVVKIFERWRADADPEKSSADSTAEKDAETFLSYASKLHD